MNFALRPLGPADLRQVAEIERQAFPTLWPPTPFKRDMHSQRISSLVATRSLTPDEIEVRADNTPPLRRNSLPDRLVKGIRERLWPQRPAEDPPLDTPLGFVSVWFLTDEAHLTVIAVERNWQGQGLGELLLIGAIETTMRRNSRVVTLEARVSNYKAISLYEKYGFKRVGTRKGYYTDNREDAAIMTTEPVNSLSYQQKFAELREAYFHRRGSVEMTLGFTGTS